MSGFKEEELLDIIQEWWSWWYTLDGYSQSPKDALYARTALILARAGRDVPMGDWVPLKPEPMSKRCPSCDSPSPDKYPDLDGCPDRWHDGRRRPEADPAAFGGA